MIKKNVLLLVCCVLVQTASAAPPFKFTRAQNEEMLHIVTNINHPSLAWRATIVQRMITEANFFADHLKLPLPHPILMTDIPSSQYPYLVISPPYFSIIHDTKPPHWPVGIYGSNIYNARIPLEARLRSLEIGVNGAFETTNFSFYFANGKLREIMRLSAPDVERYARNLDDLIGKISLIDTNGAYQLATQWLAAVDVDMTAVRKLKWTVNQLHYQARGATNHVTLPLYYVDFGTKHYPASGNLKAFDEPLVSVEVLGTTKELQDLKINDLSFSRRPLLLITNALDLIRTPNPPLKHLEQKPIVQTNSSAGP